MLIVNILVGSYLIAAFFISLSMLLLNYPTLRKMSYLKLVVLFMSSPLLVARNLIKEREDERI